MLRVGRVYVLTSDERERLAGNLTRAEAAMACIETSQADLRRQQDGIIEKQAELLREARRERDLAHARATEYQELFVGQQAEIDSLQRQLSVAHHPSTQPPEERS